LKGGELKPKTEEAQRRDKIRKESGIDMNEALVTQVGYLEDKYQEWVHIPQTSTKNVYMLTKGGFIEFNSRTKWWLIPLTWIPFTLWELNCGITVNTTILQFLTYFILGMMVWTTFEYSAHRFFFSYGNENTFLELFTFLCSWSASFRSNG